MWITIKSGDTAAWSYFLKTSMASITFSQVWVVLFQIQNLLIRNRNTQIYFPFCQLVFQTWISRWVGSHKSFPFRILVYVSGSEAYKSYRMNEPVQKLKDAGVTTFAIGIQNKVRQIVFLCFSQLKKLHKIGYEGT